MSIILKDYNKIENIINDNFDTAQYISDDYDWGRKNQVQLDERDELYTCLLSDFQTHYSSRQTNKEKYRWQFYYVVSSVLVAVAVIASIFLCSVLARFTNDELIKAMPIVITAFASLASALVAIPLTIAKYFFNTKEDIEITRLILNMQGKDLENRSSLHVRRGK
jgi:hypothetical protein